MCGGGLRAGHGRVWIEEPKEDLAKWDRRNRTKRNDQMDIGKETITIPIPRDLRESLSAHPTA